MSLRLHPGTDEFTVGFFKSFWEQVKAPVVEVKESLVEQFSEKEIKESLDEMKVNSAPGTLQWGFFFQFLGTSKGSGCEDV
jgi:hypothetical protein